jgi:biopolymer transport protein ExbD
MAKFRKDGGKEQPAINTSALPDIVFMLLFFFMVATKMRDPNVMVKTAVPTVSEVEKIVKKSWVNFILIGPPTEPEVYGTAPRIQLDDKFANQDRMKDIQDYIIMKISEQPEEIQKYLTTSIKADKSVKMGLIQDVKQELRKANALKLLYSSNKGSVKNQN